MPQGKATYHLTFFNGTRMFKREHKGAPGNDILGKWGASLKAQCVVRYYPSKKGWFVVDLRSARQFSSMAGTMAGHWTGLIRGERNFPSQEAAEMYVLAVQSRHSSTG